MNYVNLGKTSLSVSRIGLGTNAVGGHNLFNSLDEAQGLLLVEEALSKGINFIDTADAYGFGRSEELIGQVLANSNVKREDIILATKGAQQRQPNGKVMANNNPLYLRSALEASLKRLGTDYVDLYYLHFPDGKIPFAESIGELARLKQEGKIKEIGISNVSLNQLKEANVEGHIAVLQSPYNMLERTAEHELLPYCVAQGISFIPYGPLAFGILGGKYTADFKPENGDWRKGNPLFADEALTSNLHKAEKLKEFASSMEIELSDLALAWLLKQTGIDSVIPGGKRPEQVASNIKANDILLTTDDLDRINIILNDKDEK